MLFQRCETKLGRWALGLVLLVFVIFIWVGGSLMIQFIFEQQNYSKPFFLTYYATALFALYLLGFLIFPQWRGSAAWTTTIPTESNSDPLPPIVDLETNEGIPADSPLINDTDPKSSKEEIEVHLTWKETLKISATFCPIWFIANYAFNISLEYTSVSSNTIISTSSSFFALILGCFCGIETFTFTKLCAVGVCISGVAMVSFSDSDQHDGQLPWVGNFLALLSAFMYGVYTVFLRVKIKNENLVSMPMFFGLVGGVNLVTLWPGLIILHLFSAEPFQLPSATTFGYITLNGFFGTVVSDMLWSLVVIFTSPLVATMGLSLTIPLAMAAEFILKSKKFSWLYLGGSCLVFFGFFLVNLNTVEKELALWNFIKSKFMKKQFHAVPQEEETNENEKTT